MIRAVVTQGHLYSNWLSESVVNEKLELIRIMLINGLEAILDFLKSVESMIEKHADLDILCKAQYLLRELIYFMKCNTILSSIVVFVTYKLFKRIGQSSKTLQDRQVILRACKGDIRRQLLATNSYPLMLRLAWSECATFDKNARIWPRCGGAIGSIRFETELRHPNNAGLLKALRLLEPIQEQYPQVSWADIIQMAGVLAVELTGGPVIKNMLYGREDAPNFYEERRTFSCPMQTIQTMHTASESAHQFAENVKVKSGDGHHTSEMGKNTGLIQHAAKRQSLKCNKRINDRRMHMHESSELFETPTPLACRLPQALSPCPDGATIPGVHIRNVFYRLGFTNKEIVALCGAHTIGRAFSERSKCTIHSSGAQGATKYTLPTSLPWGQSSAPSEFRSIGMPGGCSWTRNWLQFDNSYFRMGKNELVSDVPTSFHDTNDCSSSAGNGNTIPNATAESEVQAPKTQSDHWVEYGRDPELLWLPTDNALQTDPEFCTYFELYAKDQSAFFHDYALAHKKMSELGARFDEVHGPISLNDDT